MTHVNAGSSSSSFRSLPQAALVKSMLPGSAAAAQRADDERRPMLRLLEAAGSSKKCPVSFDVGDVTVSMNIQALYKTVPIGQLKDMRVVKSAFQLPVTLSYKDYISKGYDDVMEKHREERRKEKEAKRRSAN